MEALRAKTLAPASGVVHDSRPQRGVPKQPHLVKKLYSLSFRSVRMVLSESRRSLVITPGGIGAIP